MRYLLLCTLWVLCLTLHGAAPAQTKQEDGGPTKPAIAISFARQMIREDDSVQAQIWLANEWEHDLTQVKLHVAIPAFLRWYVGTCQEWQEKNFQGQATQLFSFGPVQARRVYAQILCFRSSADIVVGDFNLLFTFEYEWPQQNCSGTANSLKAHWREKMQGRPPMRWRTMTYHHFWKYYQLIHQLGAADFWKLQMPFIGHPTHTDITLVTGSADFTGVVRPLLFLSAMGWSTNLNIRLRGHMRPSHLQDFVSLLPHKSASFFEVNGTRKTLPEVFEFFAARVRQDVYQPNLVDTLKLKRYLVMTLSQFSGEIGFYRSQSAGVKQIQIPAADRALLHSILTGTTLDVPELIRREQQKKFLLTRFADPLDSTNPDFALTYFDHGSLIFMQRTALTENYT